MAQVNNSETTKQAKIVLVEIRIVVSGMIEMYFSEGCGLHKCKYMEKLMKPTLKICAFHYVNYISIKKQLLQPGKAGNCIKESEVISYFGFFFSL